MYDNSTILLYEHLNNTVKVLEVDLTQDQL